MREAIWRKYGLAAQMTSSISAHPPIHPRITIVDRGPPPQSRRIINQHDLLAAAHQFGDAELVMLQKLSFQEQLHVMSRTDIFIGAHGSGIPMMLFMPSHGVTVELKAYRHGLDRDYTHGHCNLARAANRTLLVWHNKWTEHTSPWEGAPHAHGWWKQHHTFLPSEQIDFILAAAIKALRQPVTERDYNSVEFLNSAEVET